MLRAQRLKLIPVHLKRSDYRIQWADEGTREFDPDDWGIDSRTFKECTEHWQVTIDLFGHSSNAKCQRFYSYGNAPHTAGVDAFTQSWSNEIAWACPPVYLVIDTMKKIAASNMLAILCVPAWRSAAFWPILFPDGVHAIDICKKILVKRPWIIRGKFCANKLMQGQTKFPFLMLYIRARAEGYSGESGSVRCPAF